MGAIEKLAQIDYLLVILGFFAILFAAKEIIEIFSYFKKKYRIKTGNEEDKEIVEQVVAEKEEQLGKKVAIERENLRNFVMTLRTILYKKRYLIFDGSFLIFVLLLRVGRIIIEKLLNIFFGLMSNMKKYLLIII